MHTACVRPANGTDAARGGTEMHHDRNLTLFDTKINVSVVGRRPPNDHKVHCALLKSLMWGT